MLQSVRRHKHGAHIALSQVADYIEGLEIVPETLETGNRNGEQDLEIVSAVHCCAHRVQIQSLTKFETTSLERDTVCINLGPQPRSFPKAQKSVGKPTVHQQRS
jgi:hypothetical protein